MTRREWLAAGLSAAAVPLTGLRHLLPAATHDRFLIKASYHAPPRKTPELRVNTRRITAQKTDTEGLFWLFDVPGLQAQTVYNLRLDGSDPWPLKTFAPPDATVDNFRLYNSQ